MYDSPTRARADSEGDETFWENWNEVIEPPTAYRDVMEACRLRRTSSLGVTGRSNAADAAASTGPSNSVNVDASQQYSLRRSAATETQASKHVRHSLHEQLRQQQQQRSGETSAASAEDHRQLRVMSVAAEEELEALELRHFAGHCYFKNLPLPTKVETPRGGEREEEEVAAGESGMDGEATMCSGLESTSSGSTSSGSTYSGMQRHVIPIGSPLSAELQADSCSPEVVAMLTRQEYAVHAAFHEANIARATLLDAYMTRSYPGAAAVSLLKAVRAEHRAHRRYAAMVRAEAAQCQRQQSAAAASPGNVRIVAESPEQVASLVRQNRQRNVAQESWSHRVHVNDLLCHLTRAQRNAPGGGTQVAVKYRMNHKRAVAIAAADRAAFEAAWPGAQLAPSLYRLGVAIDDNDGADDCSGRGSGGRGGSVGQGSADSPSGYTVFGSVFSKA